MADETAPNGIARPKSRIPSAWLDEIERRKLKFDFPGNKFFNYFAYIAADKPSNRVKWVNENLNQDSMDNLQAGVAFLGFAKFEELMAVSMQAAEAEEDVRVTAQQPIVH